jgi:hypothetical protein
MFIRGSGLMKTTDWQGQEYGPGDTVLYAAMSGRCVTMIKAEVLDIWETYQSDETWKWERLDKAPHDLQIMLREHDAGVEREYDKKIHLRVQVKPVGSSRWKQHYGKDFYIDNRTGKRIDPWRGTKHWANADEAGDYCLKTGAKLDEQCCVADGCRGRLDPWGSRNVYHRNDERRHVAIEFRDYVERAHQDTKVVTLIVTENITKI